jgi:hypothetical protein
MYEKYATTEIDEITEDNQCINSRKWTASSITTYLSPMMVKEEIASQCKLGHEQYNL